MKFNELQNQAEAFLIKSLRSLKSQDVELEPNWHIDHLCYRSSTSESYRDLKDQFSQLAALLVESEVNGRMISTFKLPRPIVVGEWIVDLIELPSPKRKHQYADGFEHFEVVVDVPFSELKRRYPNVSYDESGLAKDFNPECEMCFDNFSIKFHHLSLESVVNIEKNSKVYQALKKSNVLKILKSYSPMVVGTFPLGVHTDKSDIDIVVNVTDFQEFQAEVNRALNSAAAIEWKELNIQHENSLLCSFKFEDVLFEIFAQKASVFNQAGYIHFLAEERLLKLLGESLKTKVTKIRGEEGLKTEPAFAKALGLSGDPYLELLKIQRIPNKELLKFTIK